MGLALLFSAPVQALPRPYGDLNLAHRLNGVPVKLGTITTAGASTTNATTATPFTVVGGSVIRVTCDAAAVFTVGSAAATAYTSASFGSVMAAGVAQTFVLRTTDTSIAVAAAVAVNCAVSVME